QVVEELDHPERAADLVPAEGRRRDLLLEVPGEVEGVRAVEHPEVVGLAPHDLLAAGADTERNAPELEVGVRLAELVVELERRPGDVRQRIEHQGATGKTALLVREVEDVEAVVRLPVDVLLLEDVRRRVVDAVVDATPQE